METVTAPQYKLLKQFYADDTLFPEEAIIEFNGIPNEQMEPLNDAAREKMAAFLKSLEEGMHEAGRISRKLEDIVLQEVANRPRENARVTMPQYRPGKPPMGNITAEGAPIKPSITPKTKLISTAEIEPQKPIVIGAVKV